MFTIPTLIENELSQKPRISIGEFSVEELTANFEALYASLDFKSELNELGVGIFHVQRRKKISQELHALAIAFWGIALERSFPNKAEDFFTYFRAESPILNAKTSATKKLCNRVNIYVDMLRSKKDTDFLPVATYLTDILNLKPNDCASFQLKLSLIMRSLYKMIFDHLF